MQKLNYFIGKLCTIITYQTTRVYSDEQHANTFTGLIDDVDEMGIWMKLVPQMKRKAFFPAPFAGIIEEEVIPLTKEQEQEIKKTYIEDAKVPDDLITLGGLRTQANQIKSQQGK